MAQSKYFANCYTLEELKKEYKRLIFIYHPDINPNGTEECQKINAEYDMMFPKLKDVHKNASNETYTSSTASEENVNEFKDIINKIIHFDGIKIEIIGSWLWLTGNTFQYKAELKELKFAWSPKKSAWFYHNEPFKKHSKNQYDMNGLRNLFGSEEIETEAQPSIA